MIPAKDTVPDGSGFCEDILRKSFTEANRVIYDASNENAEYAGMGTTLVAAWIVKEYCHVCNVGDSRGYLFRDGRLKQLTSDHTVVAELVSSGKLNPEDVRHHPYRNQLTRTVGTGLKLALPSCHSPYL